MVINSDFLMGYGAGRSTGVNGAFRYRTAKWTVGEPVYEYSPSGSNESNIGYVPITLSNIATGEIIVVPQAWPTLPTLDEGWEYGDSVYTGEKCTWCGYNNLTTNSAPYWFDIVSSISINREQQTKGAETSPSTTFSVVGVGMIPALDGSIAVIFGNSNLADGTVTLHLMISKQSQEAA